MSEISLGRRGKPRRRREKRPRISNLYKAAGVALLALAISYHYRSRDYSIANPNLAELSNHLQDDMTTVANPFPEAMDSVASAYVFISKVCETVFNQLHHHIMMSIGLRPGNHGRAPPDIRGGHESRIGGSPVHLSYKYAALSLLLLYLLPSLTFTLLQLGYAFSTIWARNASWNAVMMTIWDNLIFILANFAVSKTVSSLFLFLGSKISVSGHLWLRIIKKLIKSRLRNPESIAVSVSGSFGITTFTGISIEIFDQETELLNLKLETLDAPLAASLAKIIIRNYLVRYGLKRLMCKEHYSVLYESAARSYTLLPVYIGLRTFEKVFQLSVWILDLLVASSSLIVQNLLGWLPVLMITGPGLGRPGFGGPGFRRRGMRGPNFPRHGHGPNSRLEAPKISQDSNSFLIDGLKLRINPILFDYIKSSEDHPRKHKEEGPKTSSVLDILKKDREILDTILSTRVSLSNMAISLPSSKLMSFDERFLPQKKAEFVSMFDEKQFTEDIRKIFSLFPCSDDLRRIFEENVYQASSDFLRAKFENKIMAWLKSFNEQTYRSSEDLVHDFSKVCDECSCEQLLIPKEHTVQSMFELSSVELNLSPKKDEIKSQLGKSISSFVYGDDAQGNACVSCRITFGSATIISEFEELDTPKIFESVLESATILVDFELNNSTVEHVQVFNLVESLRIPAWILQLLKSPETEEPLEPKKETKVKFSLLSFVPDLFGTKFVHSAVFNHVFFHSSDGIVTANRKTLELAVDDLHVRSTAIDDVGYSACATKGSSIPLMTHELVTLVTGLKIDIFSKQQRNYLARVPWAATTIRTNLECFSAFLNAFSLLMNMKALTNKENLDSLVPKLYTLSVNVSICNPLVTLDPDSMLSILLWHKPTLPKAQKEISWETETVCNTLEYVVRLLPKIQANVGISGVLMRVSNLSLPLDDHKEKISFVAECEQVSYEIRSVPLKHSRSPIVETYHDPDIVSFYPDLMGTCASLEKSIRTHLSFTMVLVRSFHDDATKPFPVLHFKSYGSSAHINVSLRPENPGDVLWDHFSIRLKLDLALLSVTMNLTKRPIIFGLCKLALIASKLGLKSENKQRLLFSRMVDTVLDRESTLRVDSILVALGSRDFLPPHKSLERALRGMQFSVQLFNLKCWRKGSQILLDLTANQLFVDSVHEDVLDISGKPSTSHIVCVPDLHVHSGVVTKVKMPYVEVDFDVHSIWMMFVMRHLFYMVKLHVKKSSNKASHKEATPIEISMGYFGFKLIMPNDVPLIFGMNTAEIRTDTRENLFVEMESLKVYTSFQENSVPKRRGFDSDHHKALFCLFNLTEFRHEFHYQPEKRFTDQDIIINLDEFSFSLPFGFAFYKVLDSVVTFVKALKQIIHNFKALKEGTPFKPVVPEVEGPKTLPIITINASKFQASIKDDSFEAELGLIFKAGLLEQKARREKEILFDYHAKERLYELAHEVYPSNGDERDTKRDDYFVKEVMSRLEEACGKICDSRGIGELSFVSRRRDLVYRVIDELVMKRCTLYSHFSKSWIRRFTKATEHQKLVVNHKNRKFLGEEKVDPHTAQKYIIKDFPSMPLLLLLNLGDLSFKLDHFNTSKGLLPQFLYAVGKKMPLDLEYLLLLPFFWKVECSYLTLMLRDYHLPLIQFPDSVKMGPTLSISGNVVFAERFNNHPVSRRQVFVPFAHGIDINKSLEDFRKNPFYGGFLLRLLDPIKCFVDLDFTSTSERTTILLWGKSLQPAISTAMICLDNVTKPPIDQSPRLGWWDKFRLIMHGRFRFNWESRVSLYIKGSSDPYMLTDEGGGLVFGWDGDVGLDINPDDDPARFMTTSSERFVLAVPHFSERLSNFWDKNTRSLLPDSGYLKVLASLEGCVRWKVGLLFERDAKDGKFGIGQVPRTNVFRPHYQVERANPKLLENPKQHDSYKHFRSQYIHLAIGFGNELNGTQSSESPASPKSFLNSFFLLPGSVVYCIKWWSLFGSSLGLPLRSGVIFSRPPAKDERKFGHALCTAKYQIALAPVYITHLFRHSSRSKARQIEFTGLKMRADNFKLDLHQQKQQFHHTDADLGILKAIWKMRFSDGKIDCHGCDARVLHTIFFETLVEDVLAQTLGISDDTLSNLSQDTDAGVVLTPDLSFTGGSDSSLLSWIDLRDYVELQAQNPKLNRPKVQIAPFFTAPRFTYLRQEDQNAVTQPYPFGSEPSHACFYDAITGVEKTLLDILLTRYREIEEKLRYYKSKMSSDNPKEKMLATEKIAILKHNSRVLVEVLNQSQGFLAYASVEDSHDEEYDKTHLYPEKDKEHVYSDTNGHLAVGSGSSMNIAHGAADGFTVNRLHSTSTRSSHVSYLDVLEAKTYAVAHSKYRNRFIVTNLLIKWNNPLKDHLSVYLAQNAESKSARYFMGRKAVQQLSGKHALSLGDSKPLDSIFDDIDEVLSMGADFVRSFEEEFVQVDPEIAEVDHDFLVKLICPQIQVHLRKTKDQVCLVLAQDIELKTLDVNLKDEEGASDDDIIARRIELRLSLILKDMQTFILSSSEVFHDNGVLFQSTSFGHDNSSKNWPPWVNVEAFFDLDMLRHVRLSETTLVLMRLNRGNRLFSAGKAGFMANDHNTLRLDAPVFEMACDSSQFEVMYSIATDLILGTAYTSDKKSQKLRALVLATDLDNIQDVGKHVEQLQHEIRALKSTKSMLLMKPNFECERALMAVNVWLQRLTLKLIYTVTALRMRNEEGALVARIRALKILWNLLGPKRTPFVGLELKGLALVHTDHEKGSARNFLQVHNVEGTYLCEDSIYSRLIGPFGEQKPGVPMVKVSWSVQQSIGGIPVMDLLQLDFLPLKIEIDTETAKKVFDFVFPARSGHNTPRNSAESRRKANFEALLEDDQYMMMAKRSTENINFDKVELGYLVLCLSYKGKGHTSIADVENLVVRIPNLSYSNTITSFKGLALMIKKDVIKVLIRHTGDIIGNKIKKRLKPHSHSPRASLSRHDIREQALKYEQMTDMNTALNTDLRVVVEEDPH